MKVKAVYRSKVKNREIIILDEVFVNNKPRVIDVDENGLKTLKGLAKQDWFKILDIYGEPAPAVEKEAPTEEVFENLVTEGEPEEDPVETAETVETAEEVVAEEAPVEVAETVEETVDAPTEEAEAEAPAEEKKPKNRKAKKSE